MIYVGFPGVGKSSIAGNGNIDLESNTFRIEGKRDTNWYKIYCNIAIDLSNQGYNVFINSSESVREELMRRKAEFTVITPSLALKDEWIEKLRDRYNTTQLPKDYKALAFAESFYNESVQSLLCENHVIEIKDMNYDLKKLIS